MGRSSPSDARGARSEFPPGQTVRNTGASPGTIRARDAVHRPDHRRVRAPAGGTISRSAPTTSASSRATCSCRRSLNPTAARHAGRASTLNVRQGSDVLTAATTELQATYPGFVPFTTGVTFRQRRRDRLRRRAPVGLEKRFSNNFSARVSYTFAHATGNTSGQRRAGEQLPGARRSEPRAERRP